LLGEALVAKALLQERGPDLLDTILGKSATQLIRQHALTVLSRMSSYKPDLEQVIVDALIRQLQHCGLALVQVAPETPGLLPQLALEAFGRMDWKLQSQVAGMLEPHFKEESLQLSELDCRISQFLVEKQRKKLKSQSIRTPDLLEQFGTVLTNYAVALDRIGQTQNALIASEEALSVFKSQSQNVAKQYMPSRAAALNNHAGYLLTLGRALEAIPTSREALRIRAQLAEMEPQKFESDYADALGNLAAHLATTGEFVEALSHASLALPIRERFAAMDPVKYEGSYAIALGNIANHLMKSGGDLHESLRLAKKALFIKKKLADLEPDRHSPSYAIALNNVGNFLSQIGEAAPSLDALQEASRIYLRLAATRPDRHEPDLALSFANLASQHMEFGDMKIAAKNAVLAQELYDRLAQKTPLRFAEEKFFNATRLMLIDWLLGTQHTDLSTNLDVALQVIPKERFPLASLEFSFFRGCIDSSSSAKITFFENVLITWPSLNFPDKNSAEVNWMCATAYCAKFAPQILPNIQWKTEFAARYSAYSRQRNGQISRTMDAIAQRLNFTFR
jgi:tetratricopeptide (TPR) repeat protein